MLILDTDHVSLLEWEIGEDYERLRSRLSQTTDQLATTIISYEEQSRGWLAYIGRARKIAQQVEAYRRLFRHLEMYRSIDVLQFDESAAIAFQSLKHFCGRIGTADVRIAAIALSRAATLLTRNTVDFERIPNLQIEDWTRPSA